MSPLSPCRNLLTIRPRPIPTEGRGIGLTHIGDTATEAGAAANQAVANKIAKYDELASTHIFYPVAIETGGTRNHWAVELVQKIGRRTTLGLITGKTRESILFQ